MADIGGDEPHVTELLGLYYLDTLGPAEGVLIEAHLPVCPQCRETADQIIDTVASLALLSERDRDEVLDNFGALNRSGPPSERFVRFFAPEPEPEPPAPRSGGGKEARFEADPEPARRRPFRMRRAAKPAPEPAPVPEPVVRPVAAPPATVPKPATVAPPPAVVPRVVPSSAPPVAPEPVRSSARPAAPEPIAVVPAPVAPKPVAVASPPAAAPKAIAVNKTPVPVTEVSPPPVTTPPPAPAPPAAAPPAAAPPAAPSPAVAPVAVVVPAVVAPVEPPGRRPGRNRRTTALVQMSLLLTLVLVIGGLAFGALLRGERGAGSAAVPVITAAATAADSATGASLSVFVTQREAGVSVRATVDGLQPGVGYRLQAVTSDGHAWPVVNWTSDGKLQDITAEVQVPLSTLVFFTVSRAGSGPVVSAYLGTGGIR